MTHDLSDDYDGRSADARGPGNVYQRSQRRIDYTLLRQAG